MVPEGKRKTSPTGSQLAAERAFPEVDMREPPRVAGAETDVLRALMALLVRKSNFGPWESGPVSICDGLAHDKPMQGAPSNTARNSARMVGLEKGNVSCQLNKNLLLRGWCC